MESQFHSLYSLHFIQCPSFIEKLGLFTLPLEDLGSVEHLEQMKQLFDHGHPVADHAQHLESMEHVDHLAHPVHGEHGEHPMEDFEQLGEGHEAHVEHPELMSFALQCAAESCERMKGSYHETGWKDGRPVYSKGDYEAANSYATT